MRFLGLLCFGLLWGCQAQHQSSSVSHSSPIKSYAHKRPTPTSHTHPQHAYPYLKTTEQDAAPPGPIPRTFKKIIPKSEPISRYGNPSAYQVDGHTYEVMPTATGYRARGLASWYGTKFHKKKTSSGENYDVYALTAAHKTLPLPTYVKIRNLSNGKQAIVKVNDRGPFHEGRIIDLSYGAAAKLGILPKGTAPVEIEALNTSNHVAHYYVQAGAFSSMNLAKTLSHQLEQITPSPVFIEKYQQYFVVKVGPFANKRMTDSLKSTLTHQGISGSFALLQ
jgi:rare lipoprotein A